MRGTVRIELTVFIDPRPAAGRGPSSPVGGTIGGALSGVGARRVQAGPGV